MAKAFVHTVIDEKGQNQIVRVIFVYDKRRNASELAELGGFHNDGTLVLE